MKLKELRQFERATFVEDQFYYSHKVELIVKESDGVYSCYTKPGSFHYGHKAGELYGIYSKNTEGPWDNLEVIPTDEIPPIHPFFDEEKWENYWREKNVILRNGSN